jgi:hypothetical protein
MSNDFYTVRSMKSRKPRVCEHCGHLIPAGITHDYVTGKWEGDFFSAHRHPDCYSLWIMLHDLAGYAPWESADFDIAEMMGYPGQDETQGMLDHCRGFFPHAVNRMEFRLREYLAR